MDSTITSPRWPWTHMVMAVTATLGLLIIMGSMIAAELGYNYFGFSRRAMQFAMGAGALAWTILLWDVWVEEAAGSRSVLVIVPLLGLAAFSWAGLFLPPLGILAIGANFLLLLMLAARYIFPKRP